MNAPLLAVSCSFALGIACVDAPHTTLTWTLGRIPVLLALTGAAMLAGLLLLRGRRVLLAGVVALAGFALAGGISATLFEFRFPPSHVSHLDKFGIDLKNPVDLQGRIVSSPLATAGGSQFDVALSQIEDHGRVIPLRGIVRVRLQRGAVAGAAESADGSQLAYGDAIRALATLERPTSYRNPGVFDYRRWLASIQDVFWVGTIRNSVAVENPPRQGAPRFDVWRVRVRSALLESIDRLYPPWTLQGRDGSVLKAVLLGDRSALDSETIENFRVSGLYHLLVISGLHVGLLALLMGTLLRLTSLGDTWRSALVLVFLLAYCSLVEMRAPTVRATIMIAAYLVARFFYREHAGLNGVGIAALILLVARPPWLFEAGFELSFAAALLIVGLVAPILNHTVEPYRRALGHIADASSDFNLPPRQAQFRLDVRSIIAWLESRADFLKHHPSISAAMVVWPTRAVVWGLGVIVFTTILQMGLTLPLAATFHRVTFVGIGLNALAIPLMTMILAVAVPTVVLGALSPALATWPAKLLALLMQALFFLTDLPHLPSWLSYRVPTPPAWVGWTFAVSIVVTAWSYGRQRWIFRLSGLGALATAAMIATSPFSPRVPSGQLEVTALDCGAGDAFFVVLPDRTTILIDVGDRGRSGAGDPFESRRWSAGEDIVSPYLWSRQIKKIDVVVMSRGEEGELPGFAAIARNFQTGEMWYAADRVSPQAWEFLDELQRRGVRLRAVHSEDQFKYGSTVLRVFCPFGTEAGAGADLSTHEGLALQIQDGASAVVFARDPDAKMQQAIENSGASGPPLVLALSCLNTLSSTGRDFPATILPRLVILSGEGNARRRTRDLDPNGDLQVPGMRMFRTQREGAVTVGLRGREWAVRAYGTGAGDGTADFASGASLTSSSFKVR
ncbi:MAG: ComEC/Rec2 family competence protein [Deltaproteobacteria bacterium]